MLKKFTGILAVFIAILLLYFIAWPVPIDPVAWNAPLDNSYTGPFAVNDSLSDIEILSIGDNKGPEDFAQDKAGRIYAATHDGWIVRLNPDGSDPENWVKTNGRPLGNEFDSEGNLIVADAVRGLISITPTGKVTVLTDMADGIAILYADDVDIAADGKIYFSDASTKFTSVSHGGTKNSSLLDILEHGGHGRLLMFDPATGMTKTLLSGLNFANGVAVSHDQQYVLVCETGTYRVMRYWIDGPRKGQGEPFIENLPGFPDNISTGRNGRFWLAFFAPRNALLDKLSNNPFLRKVIHRLPSFVRPKAAVYGHITALDENGKVVMDFQDPNTRYPQNTSVLETDDYLYIGSLTAPVAARMSKAGI